MHAAVPSLFRPLSPPRLAFGCFLSCRCAQFWRSFCLPFLPFLWSSARPNYLSHTDDLRWWIWSNLVLAYLSICNNPVLSHLILSLTFLSYPSACSSYCPHVRSWSLLVSVFTSLGRTKMQPRINISGFGVIVLNACLYSWSQSLEHQLISSALATSRDSNAQNGPKRPKTAQNHPTGPTITWWKPSSPAQAR